jgi:hypothetical protein
MPSLVENVCSSTPRKTLKGWLIHMDKACPRNSERAQKRIQPSRAERLPHLAYSPDLVLSDFFLFEYVNNKLCDYNCKSREDLIKAITEIFTRLNQEALLRVFESWLNRGKWVIKHWEKCYAK